MLVFEITKTLSNVPNYNSLYLGSISITRINALMEYTRVNIIVFKLFMANTILIAHVCVCVCTFVEM